MPFQKRLTFHLWGPASDPGITCQSQPTGGNSSLCGIPDAAWTVNPVLGTKMNMPMPPPPDSKQQVCNNKNSMLPGQDCF